MGSLGALKTTSAGTVTTVTSESGNGTKSKLEEQLEKYRRLSAENPNNSLYKDGIFNYEKYVKEEKKMDPSKKSFSGIQAAIALTNQKEGATVQIQGNAFEGTYKLQMVRIPGFTPGLAWVQQGGGGHSFVNNMSTVASQLRLIRGGRVKENKQAKVKIK